MLDENEYVCHECTRVQLLKMKNGPNTADEVLELPIVTHEFTAPPHPTIPVEAYALTLSEQEQYFRYDSRIMVRNSVPLMMLTEMGRVQSMFGLRGLVNRHKMEDMTLMNAKNRAKLYGLEIDIDEWAKSIRDHYHYPQQIAGIIVNGMSMWNRLSTIELLMLALNCENVTPGTGLCLIYGEPTPIRVG